jgi:hypothetical protein
MPAWQGTLPMIGINYWPNTGRSANQILQKTEMTQVQIS